MKKLTKLIIFLVAFFASSAVAHEYKYKGSNSIDKGSLPGGFWHSGKILNYQVGWDDRIYIYFFNKHKCGSNLVFYEPTAAGRQNVFEAVMKMEHYQREINVRVDRCQSTENGVIFGFFDKLETVPIR